MIRTLDERNVTARKDHTCQLCVRDIPKGEEHFTQRNADGSEIWTYRAHLKCWRLLGAYWKSIDIEPQYVDDYDRPDDAEFRTFVDSR